MTLALAGIAVSPGVAVGRAYVLRRDDLDILEYAVPPEQVDNEVKRFRAAVRQAHQQLKSIRKRIPRATRADIAAFIDTHLLMLEDATFADAPVGIIRKERCNAEWALKMQRDALVQVFDEMDDPYLRTRKDDVDHVVTRILRILVNGDRGAGGDLNELASQDCVLVADDLTPADTVLMQHQGICAFITEYGAPFSHTAILARSLGIPAVVAVRGIQHYLRDGDVLIIDGRAGVIIADPDAGTLAFYRARRDEEQRYRQGLKRLRGRRAVTRDGVEVGLQANIELPEDVDAVHEAGADGVGLYRTEFLYMNRDDTPDEDEQFDRYAEAVERLDGRPVTIRSLDLGADKDTDGAYAAGRVSTNPALGLRAIRLCLHHPELFRPQLRAVLRASAIGPVRLMLPMISSLNEVHQTVMLIEEIKQELAREGRPFDPLMPVGGMIEIPGAALAADLFARELDFLSIGTNDLIQYTLAADRIDDAVNYLYDPLHPAVLALIHNVLRAGRRLRVPVSMCGEMAGDPRYTRLLLGLGLRVFSMQPAALLEVKRMVTLSDTGGLTRLAQRLLRSTHPERRAAILDEFEGHSND